MFLVGHMKVDNNCHVKGYIGQNLESRGDKDECTSAKRQQRLAPAGGMVLLLQMQDGETAVETPEYDRLHATRTQRGGTKAETQDINKMFETTETQHGSEYRPGSSTNH